MKVGGKIYTEGEIGAKNKSKGFPNSTDLINCTENYLTPEADASMMSVAPAAAFPTYEVPLIRMPE
jgi:hypothetical protein